MRGDQKAWERLAVQLYHMIILDGDNTPDEDGAKVRRQSVYFMLSQQWVCSSNSRTIIQSNSIGILAL